MPGSPSHRKHVATERRNEDSGREHGHSHPDHSHAHAAGPLGKALVLTAAFMVIEFVSAMMAGSLALLADAGHMLTDTAALTLAWAATRIAARPADTRRSFGYQRLRVLATFINGCALLFVVAWIAIEAVQRLFAPPEVNATIILWVGTLGLAVNIAAFALLRHGHDHAHDMNVAAATLHVLGDLLGSVAAILAAAIILWTGWLLIDPLLSLAVCGLLVRSAWALVQRSGHILMEGSPDWIDLAELRSLLEQRIPSLKDVHHVHCWLIGPHEALLTMHASVDAGADQSLVLRDIKSLLAERFGITHTTIQVEVECVDAECQKRTG